MTPAPTTSDLIAIIEHLSAQVAHLAEKVEALTNTAAVPRPAPEPDGDLLTAEQVANKYGFRIGWVYENKEFLGVMRMGETGGGRKPRLRFDPDRAQELLGAGRTEGLKSIRHLRPPGRPTKRLSKAPTGAVTPSGNTLLF